ncbi:hypothetical protein KUCAC02_001631, partial [Chaenocephalus aceratus]
EEENKSIVFSSSCDHCACETAAVGMEMDTGSPASDLPLLQHKAVATRHHNYSPSAAGMEGKLCPSPSPSFNILLSHESNLTTHDSTKVIVCQVSEAVYSPR